MATSNAVTQRLRPIRWVVSIVLVGLLLWIIDPRTLATTIAAADSMLVIAICGMAFVWLLLGAMNVWLLLRSLGSIPLAGFIEIYVTSWAVGLLIPGQLGDATQVMLVRRYGLSASSAAAAYATDKLLSLALYALVGGYGVVRYGVGTAPTPAAIALILAILIIATLFIAAIRMIWRTRFSERAAGFIESFHDNVRSFGNHPGLLTLNVAGSVTKWLIAATMYYAAFAALGETIDFESAATIPIVSSLVAYIPVTIAGLGTMEWTAIGLFGGLGIQPLTVVGVYVIIRGVLIACAALMMIVWRGSRYARAD